MTLYVVPAMKKVKIAHGLIEGEIASVGLVSDPADKHLLPVSPSVLLEEEE